MVFTLRVTATATATSFPLGLSPQSERIFKRTKKYSFTGPLPVPLPYFQVSQRILHLKTLGKIPVVFPFLINKSRAQYSSLNL